MRDLDSNELAAVSGAMAATATTSRQATPSRRASTPIAAIRRTLPARATRDRPTRFSARSNAALAKLGRGGFAAAPSSRDSVQVWERQTTPPSMQPLATTAFRLWTRSGRNGALEVRERRLGRPRSSVPAARSWRRAGRPPGWQSRPRRAFCCARALAQPPCRTSRGRRLDAHVHRVARIAPDAGRLDLALRLRVDRAGNARGRAKSGGGCCK
jgi:hypothetical protein